MFYLFLWFIDAVINSDYTCIVSNVRMVSEYGLEVIWKEVVVV